MNLVLSGCRMSRSLHPPARVLRVYREALMGFSQVLSPDGLNNILLSQGCILEVALSAGTVGRMYIPRIRAGVRSCCFNCWRPVLGSPCGHVLFMTSSNKDI